MGTEVTGFGLDYVRRLLSDLHTAIDERVRSEQALAAFDDADPTATPDDDVLQALADEIQRETDAADARHANERDELNRRYQATASAAIEEHDATAARVRQRIDGELAAVEEQYAENTWMLSSLLDDDTENSPKRQYDTLSEQLHLARERLTSQWEDLKTRYARATELQESRRQRIDTTAEPPVDSRTRKDAHERFEAAERMVRGGLDRLERQTLPRLFAGWTFVLLGVLLWGGLFTAGYLLVDPQTLGLPGIKPAGHVLLAAGGGFAFTALFLMTLWAIAAARSARAFHPVQQGMVDAQAAHQTWLRLAKDELQRSERQYRERHDALVERRDRSLQRFTAERDERTAALHAQRERELREPAIRRDAILREASIRLNQDLLASETAHRRETTALRTRLEREQRRLTDERDRQRSERDRRRQQLQSHLGEAWAAALQRLGTAVDIASDASREQFPDWSAVLAPDWTPPDTVPHGIRLGEYVLDLQRLANAIPADPRLAPRTTSLRFPAELPFPDPPTLVVQAAGEGRAAANSVLQVAMLRLLTLLPPGKVRFTIIDPVGLGEQFASFMHLADYDERLISGRIWTEPARIEQQLGDLTEHMENVFQKYLRNEFETIEEYNAHAGEVAEPYRVLVIANFPHGFTERAAQRLTSIAASGRRCGVFALVGVDTRQPRPHGFDFETLESGAALFRWDDREFLAPGFRPDPVVFQPGALPSAGDFVSVVRRIGEHSKDVRRVEVPFHRIAPTENHYWSADSRRSIDCPLGRSGATRLQHLRLGTGTSQHVLIAGKTGSGKSTLLHVLITNLALRYAPSEIEFYLIDFKKGVEFKAYATHRLPHARVIAIESDREFGVSVLERLDAILKTRGDEFREAGVQDIAAFRDARPETPMPRILLVVDEFQEFFTEDDRYSQTASLLLDRLVRQGRAFGIHVLLGSQTLGGAYSLARATIGQMAVRIALQCSDTDASLILSEDNAAARLLTRPGEAIYNDANGMVDGNSPFQVAWLGDDERDTLLDRIHDLAVDQKLDIPPPVVFEGNVPADPSQNAFLMRRLTAAEPAEPSAHEPLLSAWIGEAVAITGPTEVSFARQSGANLLLVGQDPAAATGILAACLIGLSAIATDEKNAPSFRLLAGTARGDRWRATLDALSDPPALTSPDEAATVIAELAEELARRRSEADSHAPPIVLILDDLSRFRDLRRSDDDFGFGGFDRDRTPSPAQRFAELLRDGPSFGLHAIVWCDSYGNADRWLSRALIREFEMRVVFQMSATDSSHLLDSPAASRLGTNRALLYRDERGTLEKFRPYGPPSDDWLKRLINLRHPSAADEPDRPEDLDINEWIIV